LKDKGHPQNTCRNLTNAPIQFLKYFGTPVKYRKNLGIYNTTLTTRDHLLTIDEVRQMWQIASLEEKVMIKTWMLGLRIGDASKIQWQQFNFKATEEPYEVLINTRKESIVAHVFVDAEFQKLLEKYIPTLDPNNKYLLQSEKGGNVKEKQLLRRLQSLQKKAGIQSNGQVFGWHIGRKLFLRTCAELGITSWNAQLMCGKSVDKSIATYINGVQLKNDAMKVHNVLKMDYSNGNGKVSKLEERLVILEKENVELKIVLRGMATVFGEEILAKAREQMMKTQFSMGVAHGLPETPREKLTPYKALKFLGENEDLQKQIAEEYEKREREKNLQAAESALSPEAKAYFAKVRARSKGDKYVK
jgi:hypothetical protein